MSQSASLATERRNVGRIDHIILLYASRESQERARQSFTATLGIEDWDEVGEGSEGIYILISWQSGIELICPTREVAAFQRHLATHGEGFYSLVFGVADLDQAMAHVKQLSGRAPYALGDPPQPVLERFDIAREAIVGELGGIRVMLGEFRAKA